MGVKERMKAIEDANATLMKDRQSLMDSRKENVDAISKIDRRIAEIDAQALQQVGAHNVCKEILAESEKPEVKPLDEPKTETEH